MDTILKFLKGVTPKQWGVATLWVLALVGLLAMLSMFRGCDTDARKIVEVFVKSQIEGDKLLADSVSKVTETYEKVLREQAELAVQLRDLQLKYEKDIKTLEQAIAAKDKEIREDISARLTARSQQLREEYEKALNDPNLARDGFLDSLHLWDDLWSSQPRSTP